MTSQTLPKNPDYAFCPAYGPGNAPQEIRLVIDGMSGSIPTAMVALTLEDGDSASATGSTQGSEWTGRPGPHWPHAQWRRLQTMGPPVEPPPRSPDRQA